MLQDNLDWVHTRFYSLCLFLFLNIFLLLFPLSVQSNPLFPLDYKSHSEYSNYTLHYRCNFDGLADLGCVSHGFIVDDPTPFLYESFTDETGTDYVHLVVGDPAQEFAQDIYIVGGISADGVAGTANGPTGVIGIAPEGQASGNPVKVVMRQSIKDSEINMEFFKGSLLTKPNMTQTVTAEGMLLEFKVDLSSIDYDDMSTVNNIENRLTLTDLDIPAGSEFFDMALHGEIVTSDAGRYEYIPGSGVEGSEGTYDYWGSEFNTNQEWWVYKDPVVNPR